MPEDYTPNIHVPGDVGEDTSAPTEKYVPGEPADSPKVENEPNQMPLAMLAEPPIVDILELGELYGNDIDDTKKRVQYIDLIIKKLIIEKDWKPNVKSYNDILSEYFFKLGLGDNDSSHTKLRKLYMHLYLPAVL